MVHRKEEPNLPTILRVWTAKARDPQPPELPSARALRFSWGSWLMTATAVDNLQSMCFVLRTTHRSFRLICILTLHDKDHYLVSISIEGNQCVLERLCDLTKATQQRGKVVSARSHATHLGSVLSPRPSIHAGGFLPFHSPKFVPTLPASPCLHSFWPGDASPQAPAFLLPRPRSQDDDNSSHKCSVCFLLCHSRCTHRLPPLPPSCSLLMVEHPRGMPVHPTIGAQNSPQSSMDP